MKCKSSAAHGRGNFFAQSKSGEKTSDKLVETAWKIFSRQGQRLIKDGKAIESPEENLSQFKTLAETFLTKQLPIFKALLL